MGSSKTLSDRRQEATRGSKSDNPKANTCTKRTFCFENIVIQNIVLKTEQLSGPRRPEVVAPAHSAADDLCHAQTSKNSVVEFLREKFQKFNLRNAGRRVSRETAVVVRQFQP